MMYRMIITVLLISIMGLIINIFELQKENKLLNKINSNLIQEQDKKFLIDVVERNDVYYRIDGIVLTTKCRECHR